MQKTAVWTFDKQRRNRKLYEEGFTSSTASLTFINRETGIYLPSLDA